MSSSAIMCSVLLFVSVSSASPGRIIQLGGDSNEMKSSFSPLESKCAVGLTQLARWKSKYAAQISDSRDVATCDQRVENAQQEIPQTPVQCQYLTYGESSNQLTSVLDTMDGEKNIPPSSTKMSTVFGDAGLRVVAMLKAKCEGRKRV